MKGAVAVVGAGLSGLTAAYRLEQAGVRAVVLEARHRVGGRAWRVDVGGFPFDAGCEAFDETHERLLALAAELGVDTWRSHAWLPAAENASPAVEALEEEVGALAARVDPEHPEETDDAAALDTQSLAARLAELGATPQELTEAETRFAVASSGVPLESMSLLAYAAKVAAGAAPTGLTLRLHGGVSALAAGLAEGLEVRLGAEVVRVAADGVRLRGGAKVAAERVVLAVPLTLQRGIRFEPPLPRHRQLALERARYGDVVKAALPPEMERERQLPHLTRDGLVYRPHPEAPLLALFAGAAAAERARRRRCLASVDWSAERWSRGSYLIFGPGDLTAWGRRLAESHGRIHFAGSEASSLPSYAEGAVRAGECAADEALAAG